jgi:hypothetical protein
MARQGGQVQLELSDMGLAMNMAKIATGVLSHPTMKEMQQLIKKACGDVRDEMKQPVLFPGDNKVKAGIKRRPAMVRENQTDGCLPGQNGTPKHPQTNWRRKDMGVPPPPSQHAPPRPGMPRAPHGDSERIESTKTECCHPDMCIYLLCLPAIDVSILIHMPRIACATKILFQIC